MRLLFIFLSLTLSFLGCSTSKNTIEKIEVAPTTVILVRHAEKQSGQDPELSVEGQARAQQLAFMLDRTPIDIVYSTDFKRTLQTAKPTASQQQKEIEIYDHNDLVGFAERLRTEHQGQTILVVGHSNTTPTLVGLLDPNNMYEQIDESDYSNLFFVSLPAEGPADVMQLRF